MNAPLSAKQHREYLKLQASEARESDKMEREESRKQELHEIKLQEAAGGANQKMGHKEQMHQQKLQELRSPLASRVTKPAPQQPSARSTDTVPAMLTPGEAVIPELAAQNPKNKEIIAQLVNEGRGYSHGTTNVSDKGLAGKVQIQNNLAIIPKVGPKKHRMGFEDGTTEVPTVSSDELTSQQYVPRFTNTAEIPKAQIEFLPEYRLSQDVLNAQLQQESGGKHIDAKTNKPILSAAYKGDPSDTPYGIAQIKPSTGAKPGYGVPALAGNTEADQRTFHGNYMAALNAKYKDQDKALTAYNAGAGSVDKAIAKAASMNDPDWKKYLPTQESREYSNKILARVKPAAPPVKVTETTQIADVDAMGNPTGTYTTIDKTPKPVPEIKNPQTASISDIQYDALGNVIQANSGIDVSTAPEVAIPLPVSKAGAGRGTQGVPAVDKDTSQAYDNDWYDILGEKSKSVSVDVEKAKDVVAADPAIPPEEKKGFLAKMIEGIYSDAGHGGLFNPGDLGRFALVAAGGMLTGGSAGGSLRYAGKDALVHADARQTQEATAMRAEKSAQMTSDKALRLEYLKEGYPADKVDAYFKAPPDKRNAAVLGIPKTTVSRLGDSKAYTYSTGPGAGQRVIFEKTQIVTGRNKGDVQWINKETGMTPEQYEQANKRGAMVPYDEGIHGTAAKAKQTTEASGDFEKRIESSLKQNLGSPTDSTGKQNNHWQGARTPLSYADQTTQMMIRHGYDITDPNVRLAAYPMINNASEKLSRDIKLGTAKINDFGPYLESEVIQSKIGVSPDVFIVGKGKEAKEMAPNDIVIMNNAVKNKVKGDNPQETESNKTAYIKSAYIRFKADGKNKFQDSENKSAFYQFLMSELKK